MLYLTTLQGHAGALDKLPSRVAATVPGGEYSSALAAAGFSAKGSRFVNFAELAAQEALQVLPTARCILHHRPHAQSMICRTSQAILLSPLSSR